MMEVISGVNHYIDLSQKHGYDAVCITEHGNILNWVQKKNEIESAGLKYIHGVEAYITNSFEEKLRDNYHLILLAKNYEGVLELNHLIANSFKGKGDKETEDKHFYYNPRISFDELKVTSDNILVLSACLGGPLWQTYSGNKAKEYNQWVKFFKDNKHRAWLEVQAHNSNEQKIYNRLLLRLAEEHGLRTVATNDVHAHDQESNEIRKILMKAKGLHFDDESEEPWWKSYEELETAFLKQGVLEPNQIKQALDESALIADQIESFTLDRKPKYPRIFGDSIKQMKSLILKGYRERGIDKLSEEAQQEYKDRVKKELQVMIKVDAVDYLLLEQHIKEEMRDENRHPGPARGSAAGSLICFFLKITDVDPIKENLIFERFINENRVSMQDIDSDWGEEDRERVQEFLLTHNQLKCASIITFGTLGIRSGFKDLARGLGYSFSEINNVVKEFEEFDGVVTIPYHIRENYKEICDLLPKIQGVVVNVGRHAAGVIVSDRDLASEIGTIELSGFKYPVSMVDMSVIEKMQYVKLDVLGLKNIEWIQRAVDLAGLDRIHPESDYVDFNDWNVAREIARDNTAIFQFESDRTGKVIKELLSETSLQRIKEFNPNITVIELLSVGTAVIRPGAVSIVEDVMLGKPKDNGYDALNAIMSDSFGYMVYQEQQIKFLTDFANRTGSEADTIRRAISKKKRDVMEHEVPLIKQEFIAEMIKRYNVSIDEIEPAADAFMDIFISSAQYSFNKSHSVSYSYITYETAWLRTYYPLEYLTAGLQLWFKNLEKTNRLLTYGRARGISFERPKFRYSKGDYFFDKNTNTIYQGTAPIKGNNAATGDLLYTLRDNDYDSFIEVLLSIRDQTMVTIDNNKTLSLIDIVKMSEEDVKALDKEIKNDQKAKTGRFEITQSSLPINKTKMVSLIHLDFFSEFGKNEKLDQVFAQFDKVYNASNKTFKSKREKYVALLEYEQSLEDKAFSVFHQCELELQYTGTVSIQSEQIPSKYAFIISTEEGKTRTTATIYNINKGKQLVVKVGSKLYRNVPFKVGDLIQIDKFDLKPKNTKINGQWTKHPTEKEVWITSLTSIRKATIKKEVGK